MEGLIIAILGGAILYLWQRTGDLQRQILSLKEAFDEAAPRAVPASRVSVTVPATRKWGEAASTRVKPDVPVAELTAAALANPAEDLQSEPSPPRQTLKIPKISLDFEDLFGRRLPIWAGGIALAVAGLFLVRYSIEAGLITPSVRVIFGFAFGLALLAAAEAAYRYEGFVKDERVRQALAGAGLATLYASFYLAGSVYGLLGSTASFIGLALVTLAAIGLSFRFGLPSAVLGLVGGFAAPTLVGSDEANLPMLALYLALITAGLALTGRRQDRAWLGLASLGGGLGWGLLLLTKGPGSVSDIIAIGGFLLLLGAAMPLLLANDSLRGFGRLVVAGLATLQMAALVDQAGYVFLAWSLYAFLAAGIAALGWRHPKMRDGSAIAAATALWILAIWPSPAADNFRMVTAAFALIFAGVPLIHIWRGQQRSADIWQVSGFPLGLVTVILWHFGGDFSEVQPRLAAVAMALALIPACAVWRLWPKGEGAMHATSAAALSSTLIILYIAGILAVPEWAAPMIGGVLATGLGVLGWRRSDRSIKSIGWGVALATLVICLLTIGGSGQLELSFGRAASVDTLQNLLRWSAASLTFVLLAKPEKRKLQRQVAEVFAALLAYVALAQIIPAPYLACATAAAAILLAWRMSERIAAQVTLLAVAGLWALWPLSIWAEAGGGALFAIPVLASDLPAVMIMLMRIVPVLVAGAALIWLARLDNPAARKILLGAAVVLGFIAAHVAYKQIFAVDDLESFQYLGLIERSLWQALMVGIALGLDRIGTKNHSAALLMASQWVAGAALAHFLYFTVILHNPLWAAQWAGPWPVVNYLLAAYAAGIAALLLLRRILKGGDLWKTALTDAIMMALIALLALSILRNLFTGGWIASTPLSPTEDLLRSLLGIVLAFGFLLWGTRSEARSWRIGSLVLMLGAVLKVFLLDTAALEGLARIASFMALGFSLIGIGWFYSKQLSRPAGLV